MLDGLAIRAIASICVKRDLWLIADEVYRDLIFDGAHLSPSGLPGMEGRTIVVNSLSKSHAMTGWRIGWSIAPAEVARHLGRVAQCSLFGAPPFVQEAATEALAQSERYVAVLREMFRSRRDTPLRALAPSNILRTSIPAGGMFMLVDTSGSSLSSERFVERALDGLLRCSRTRIRIQRARGRFCEGQLCSRRERTGRRRTTPGELRSAPRRRLRMQGPPLPAVKRRCRGRPLPRRWAGALSPSANSLQLKIASSVIEIGSRSDSI